MLRIRVDSSPHNYDRSFDCEHLTIQEDARTVILIATKGPPSRKALLDKLLTWPSNPFLESRTDV
jgi:hypothetical protein